jgi:hypothetical protein
MKHLLLAFCTLLFLTEVAAQTNTMLTVRTRAKDAKFIGSSMGGSYITVRNAENDELLAEGYTEGSTGNTTRIMSQPYTRYDDLADVNTAAFRTEIPLTAPTLVTIEAQAPGHHRQARVRVSTQVWMIPGRDIVGDGIVLEIPGFVVDVLLPRQHQFIPLESLTNRLLPIRANMVMMCGCTISDGGLWNAREMEVTAIITKDGEQVRAVPLAIGDTDNLFEGEWMVDEPGTYQITVYGFDPRTFNSGVDVVNIVINE